MAQDILHGQARQRRRFALATPLLFLCGLLGSHSADAGIQIEIRGVDEELRGNILAFLSLARYEERELDADTIERLHNRVDREVKSALRPFGYYDPTVKSEVVRQTKEEWRTLIQIDPGQPVTLESVNVRIQGPGKDDPLFRRIGKNLQQDLAETAFNSMAELVDKPLINLESAMSHPCQALADWKTLDDHGISRQGKFVLSWVYHPRALPLAVPATAVHMAAMRGMTVVVLRPEGFALPAEVMEKARRAAASSGGSVEETANREEALAGAQVVYAKEWGSATHYGNAEEDARLRSSLTDWCVQENWFARSAKDCRLMHCLPVRRNTAVCDAVLDSPRSIVQREAFNRLVVQMAVLYRLLK